MVAMETVTDNANKIKHEVQQKMNKTRQEIVSQEIAKIAEILGSGSPTAAAT